MSFAKKTRRAPSATTGATDKPAAPPKPSGFGYHVISSDGGSATTLELHLPLAADRGEDVPAVSVRLHVGLVWGARHGTAGWESIDVPIDHLEDFARQLTEAIALAKHHRMLPEGT